MTTGWHLNPRIRAFRPLIGIKSRENGTGGTLQAGFTTYDTNADGQETYQVSYVEWGGRSDHLNDIVDHLCGNEVTERLVANAGEDADYVGSVKQNDRSRSRQAKADKTVGNVEPTVTPDLKVAS